MTFKKNLDLNFYETNFSKNLNSNLFIDREEIKPDFFAPYLKYEKYLTSIIRPNFIVLDLCVGDGIHSIIPAKLAHFYYALEPSKSGLKILEKRLEKENIKNYKLINSTIEEFNLNQSFDLITIVNSISYFDKNEILRIYKNNLKKGGRIIIIDSLNNNIFYKINHYFHVFKKNRTFKTISRIFSFGKLQSFLLNFDNVENIHFYGPFLFLKKLMYPLGMKNLYNKMAQKDQNQSIFARYSFKFLAVIKKISDSK